MELWQILLMIAVLSWLLFGLMATIIPHRSATLRAKLIVWSRTSLRRSFHQHAKRTRRTPREVERAYGFLDRDETHLWRSYFGLTLMGPFAFLLLWSISNMRSE